METSVIITAVVPQLASLHRPLLCSRLGVFSLCEIKKRLLFNFWTNWQARVMLGGYQRLTDRPLKAKTVVGGTGGVLGRSLWKSGTAEGMLPAKPTVCKQSYLELQRQPWGSWVDLQLMDWNFCYRDLEKKLPTSKAQANKVTIIKRKLDSKLPGSQSKQKTQVT